MRPHVAGKFLWHGERKLYVRGVTYGTFRPGADGSDYPPPERVEQDLAGMAAAGFNTVRTYTVPPRFLLDAAARHGLLVMVGLPWEQHITFLDDRRRCRAIEQRIRQSVRACAGHPALLCFAIGNEIPGSVVRWHGRRRVEAFLERLYRAAKDEDPGALITYVNFPTTEYLELPFVDLCAFNVYLEDEERLEAYLARLQVIAGDRPLLMAEIGLDSRRNGQDAQAESLSWQLRCAFRAGCAGATVFAWTDEWHRGGHDIEDWDFGLVTRERAPKPALEAVRRALTELPLPHEGRWPRVSVVVCSYNGSATLGETLAALGRIDYPDYEVVVVDDGSTDETAAIAEVGGARVVRTPNRGLSSARNTGARAASGEIVAYLDDDAAPDPHWLRYLAATFRDTDHVAVGGPNLPPLDVCPVADCVSNAPGGPVHVLLSDTVAEHVPGCNMAVRRRQLLEIGGFDPQFRVAGDDVDVCWRLQERGWTIGWSPAAMVWHHPRRSVRAFWRQQRGYGRAEAMLERKWPEKYNGLGHLSWRGRIYAPGDAGASGRWRVYYGTWGSGPFQRLYAAPGRGLGALPRMPEWLLLIAGLSVAVALSPLWSELRWAAAPLAGAAAAFAWQVWRGAARARFRTPATRLVGRARLRSLTALLFAVHSTARLWGRLTEGLVPWTRPRRMRLGLPRRRRLDQWSERWQAPEQWLEQLEARVRETGTRVLRGGDFDSWDLEVRGRVLGGARIAMAVEEHGAGRQQLRFRIRPRASWLPLAGLATLAPVIGDALADGVPGFVAGGVALAVALVLVTLGEVAYAVAVSTGAIAGLVPPAVAEPSTEPGPASRDHRLGELLEAAPPGAVVAVLARPGSQRPVLAQLLSALYTDASDLDDPDFPLRERRDGDPDLAVIPRRPFVLPLTVAENIALARPGTTPAEIEAAARAAGAHAAIERLPRGYRTIARHGALPPSLCRRLAFARAFLWDVPTVLLADESAAENLGDVVAGLARDRRLLVATATTAWTRRAARVVVVDGRRVLECGRPSELLLRRGLYAELCRREAAAALAESPRARRFAPAPQALEAVLGGV